ncbi:DUF1015 family protein [Verrucomicrobiales bacterium]|jgi:uncharacterized protein (DUF1015 family)|nr:DUF1015 family protein [bacterium]MDC0504400.1 DUF1015 family protein [Verrucomicrobiales bacterium]MDF1789318.1 DUF1015 family protein [Verrucomicrobiales bacterium]
MRTRAFQGLIPHADHVEGVATVPYDVVNTEEARALASGRPNDLLHVDRAEIDLPADTDPYSDVVYETARKQFVAMQEQGILLREEKPCIYVYEQIMGEHRQTGITLACHIDDYGDNIIRKHEKTRPVKEDDRTKLVDTLSAHTGPIFLTYKDREAINARVAEVQKEKPLYDITDERDVQHRVWRLTACDDIIAEFDQVPLGYVADGHHRSASAWRVGSERREKNASHSGDESYNWFLGVLFPASQLKVLGYHRVIKDLNGLSKEDFLDRLKAVSTLEANGQKDPSRPGETCVYVDGQWYTMTWPANTSESPIEKLDVSVLDRFVLDPVLGIKDVRTDSRIDFVGGIRGTGELEKRVDSGDFAVAFSMFPVTVDQLMEIADADEIMPPKSTWFEPKLRSGLFVYTID